MMSKHGWMQLAVYYCALVFGLFPMQTYAQGAQTDVYPQRSVRIVVPVSAGGSTDKIARLIAEKLGTVWGQTVIVENITGAGGAIGAAQVARAKPDGYTLVLHSDAIVLNTILIKNPPYTSDDLTGVMRLVVNPQVLVSNPGFGPQTFKEYVEFAKANPGKLTLALPTSGGIAHIAHEVLANAADIKVNYIPYKGGAPAALDTMAGHVNATIITLAAVSEQIKAGKLRALAVTTNYRSPVFPEVNIESWQGLLAPKGTPLAVLEKINKDVTQIMRDPANIKQIEALGFSVSINSVPEVQVMLRDLRKKYAETIEKAGIVQQ
ncbi:MAG: tripartite tricarboxylate transporter substrate-binding protein [Burkholderiales bacterium]|nr:tripartite tricarboxylate transporter substrate-binding protein [Burkholderiales bacterium]